MEHTKGPWKVDGTIIQDEAKHTIAQVWPDTRLSSSKSLAQMKANARLIAAVSELLAACVRLKNYVCGDCPDKTTNCSGCHYEPYIRTAKAAIAKATVK